MSYVTKHVQPAYWRMMSLMVAVLLAALNPVSAAVAPIGEIVCIQCHGAMSGKYGEPVKLWRGSIHDENGIACNACHGGDPVDAANAMSPARGFLGAPKEAGIPAFCGRCHVGVLQVYLSSAHGKALGRGGPTCVTCHGNHRVVKASLDLINEKNCGRCHGYSQAEAVKKVMGKTEGMILEIDTRIAGFKSKGIDTDRLEKSLFAVRNRFHQLFHTVDTKMVDHESQQIQSELGKLGTQLAAIDESLRKRKLAGAAAVAGFLVLALLLYLFGKTYDRQEK